MAETATDWEEFDRADERRRRRVRKLSLLEIQRTLLNTDGIAAIDNISGAEWQAAELQDAEAGDA